MVRLSRKQSQALRSSTQQEGKRYKMRQERLRLDIREKNVPMSTVKHIHRLPREAVVSILRGFQDLTGYGPEQPVLTPYLSLF